MKTAVIEHRQKILDAVTTEIEDIFYNIASKIEKVAPWRFAELGCGQASIELLIYHRFFCDLILIDIEDI